MTTDEPDQSKVLNFELRPNCLITRRPLVFITPPRSLFWYKKPWQDMTHVLYEHGYAVSVFQLPFQKIGDQKKIVLRNIDRLKKSHIFLDSVSYENLKDELQGLMDSTITVVSSSIEAPSVTFQFHSNYKNNSFNYFIHQVWCRILGLKTPPPNQVLENCPDQVWHLFLDHCVQLAEIDFEKD